MPTGSDPSSGKKAESDPKADEKNVKNEEKERAAADSTVSKDKRDKKKEEKDELTEDDKTLKENLELLVTVITESPPPSKPFSDYLAVQLNALESLRSEIKSSTSSMTSIPKPLKFLKPHYQMLKDYHSSLDTTKNRNAGFLAEILSVLAMTNTDENVRETLKYKLISQKQGVNRAPLSKTVKTAASPSLSAASAASSATAIPSPSTSSSSSSDNDIGAWGHEYVRHLSGEISKEFASRQQSTPPTPLPYTDLDSLIDSIVPFFMDHSAEFDAIDLLIEVEALDKITKFLSKENHHVHQRVCAYILKCSDYIVDAEEHKSYLDIVYNVHKNNEDYAEAIRIAIRNHDQEQMATIMESALAKDELLAKQVAFIVGSHRIVIEKFKEDERVAEIMGNVVLSGYFQQLAKDLDVKEAKSPEDIYKSHLEEGGSSRRGFARAGASATTGVDSAKQNLAASFVSAFVNAASGTDKLITPEGSDWLYKNKSHGMLSATASVGMLLLWDVESGFSAVDKYSFSSQSQIKAGAALAHGMLSSGISSEMDAAAALLGEHIESKDVDLKLSAIFGLGLAYANTSRDDVVELLMPLIVDPSQSMEIVSHACLSLGLVFCGTAHDDISSSMIEIFMERSDTDLQNSAARIMCLGVGLLFLNSGANVEPVLTAIKAIAHPINKYLEITVNTCAYVGISSPLEIQKYLTMLLERIEEDEKDPLKGIHQEVAVLGIAMISMQEELTAEMALRSLDHILQYGEVNVRRVIPLALGLLSISNPRLTVMDTLSKLTHDSDQQVSQNAVLALGFLGAGTNNSRVANILRGLASYYSKEPNHLFLVRIAQGLLHLGKGLLTLDPMQSDHFSFSRSGMAGLVTVMHAALDMKNTLLGKRHYLLFGLVPAIRPRMLMTLDEDLKPIQVPVRVGQKVDVVGQAGKPKSITGFQTHKTPVLISTGERAELGTDEYIALTNVLEGFVIVKKNPNYKPTA